MGRQVGRGSWLVGMMGLASGAFVGCGGGSGEASRSCGEGTVEKSGVCTPAQATGLTCGSGTKEVDGACTLEGVAPSGGAVSCGEGTVDVGGVCKLDPSSKGELACGEGTTEVDGVCEPEHLSIEGYAVTRFDIVLPKGGQALTNYPITVVLGTRADTPFNAHMTVGMTNYVDGIADDDIHSCFIGGFQVKHSGGGAEVETTATLYLPESCLDAQKATPAAGGTVGLYPTLSFDSTEDLSPSDPDRADIRFFAGDPAIAGCTSTAAQSDGKCGYHIEVAAPSGLDLELAAAVPESSVLVLQTVPDSVVKTPAGDMIYGAPELKMNIEVMAYGASVLDENGQPLNVLDDDDVTVTYAIRPTGATDDEVWQPIFLHEQGDGAKADGDVTIANLDAATETQVFGQAPQYFDHGLYIEDDCGTLCGSPVCTFNDTCDPGGYCKLDPDAGECDGGAVARSWIMNGKWHDFDHFTVRACLDSAAEGAAIKENDCVFGDVLVVRVDNAAEEAAPADTSGGNLDTVPTPDKSLTKSWADSVGGSALQLSYGISSETAARLWTPAVGTANDAWVTLSSSYIGSSDVMRGWMHGHVNAAQGWAYDIGLSAFGTTLWDASDGDEGAAKVEFNFEQSKEWSKKKGWSFNFMAGPIPIGVEFGFEGTVSIAAGFDVNAGFTETDAYANLEPYITPGAALTGYAKAGVNLGVTKAGVGVDLSIMDGSLPMTFGIGITADPVNKKEVTATVHAAMNLSLSTLSGNLYAFAEKWKIKCKKHKPWTCKGKWSTFWQANVFSFGGVSWNYPIFSQDWSTTVPL